MKPSSADPSLIPLQQQLQIIDRAIEIIATEKDLSPEKLGKSQRKGPQHSRRAAPSSSLRNSQSLSHLIASKKDSNPIPIEDESFKIQTMSLETVTCPHCLQQVEMKGFKLHESQLCTNKIVTCPNAGCQATMHASSLQFHLQEECLVAKQRREILQRAAQRLKEKEKADEQRKQEEILRREEALRAAALREKQLQQQQKQRQSTSIETEDSLTPPPAPVPTSVLCSQCGEAVRESQLPYHMQKTCHFRLIMCPNYGNGCNDRAIPYALLNQHLQEKCPAEMLRAQLIAKSRQRQELVQCSTCGEMVTLAKWRRHEVELCPNRLVPCRNHSLGCPCMLPLKERHLHEHIDEGYERFTCYFPGSGSHLAIDEGDIVSPWTAEFWLYRPHATESLKQHIINIMLLLTSYESSFAVEMRAHRRIMKVVLALKDDGNGNSETSEMVKKMDKNERKLWQKAQVDQKVAWVNELTTMIPVYTDAMLGYLQAFQSLAINVEAGLAAAREVKFYSNPAWDEDTLISLQSDYPGRVAEPKQELGSFAVAVGETSSPSSRHISSKHPHRPHNERKAGVNIDGVIMEENDSDLISVDSRSLRTGDEMGSIEASTSSHSNHRESNNAETTDDKRDISGNMSSSPNALDGVNENPNSESRKLPTLTKEDLERIISLWQGESHICKLFQFACQTIALEDLQIQVSKEQTVFENLQLAQEAEMTMLEENHKLWLLREEDKERIRLEEFLREKELKEAIEKESAENPETEGDKSDTEIDNKQDNDNESQNYMDEKEGNISEREHVEEKTTTEHIKEDVVLSPETLIEASVPELEAYPTVESMNEEEKEGKQNDEVVVEKVDYLTKREAKSLYPDFWETGGAIRLVLFRRALEKERLLVRETHVHEISTQLKRLEDIQAKKAEMDMAYTRFVDELIDLLGVSFSSLQNTQQFFYQFLHAPVNILFPSTSAQMEAFQRDAVGAKQTQNNVFLESFDDGINYSNPVFANIAESKRITAHTIDDWIGLLQCMARLLKRDFDSLQKLRIAAGLLTPEVKKKKPKKGTEGIDGDNGSETASVKQQKTEEEIEKSIKKKEKEKLRRELRKNKKALEQEEEEQVNSPSAETKKSSKDSVSINKPTNKDVKIITRTSELLRAGCGAEILAESATVNKDGNRCRLIGSMFSGLSILTMEFDDTLAQTQITRPSSSNKNLTKSSSDVGKRNETEDDDEEGVGDDDEEDKENQKNDPHYELLMSKAEFQKLSSFGGQVGLIFAPTSSIAASSNDKKMTDNKRQALIDSLGTQAVMYNCKITRGKWTHLVYVSQPSSLATPSSSQKKKRPRKLLKKSSKASNPGSSLATSNSARILLYVDGQYIGGQRDCSMALPMLSIAGSPWSLQSFCGVLLDVRLWARPRSGQQINQFAHRLVTLSPIVVTHSGSSLDAPIDYHVQPAGSGGKDNDHIPEDAGLIAWWTFDDGPGCTVVTDVTRHRFKTPLNYSVITSKSILPASNADEMTITEEKNSTTRNTPNGVGSVVVRTWDWRHEAGDPSRYPAPHELLQEYIEYILHLAIAKQASLPVYLGYRHDINKNREILYQVQPVPAPPMILAVAVSSVQNQPTDNIALVTGSNNSSRPATSDGVKSSRPGTSRTTASTAGINKTVISREGLNSRGGDRVNATPPIVMTFLPQPRFALTMPYHVASDSGKPGILAAGANGYGMLTTRTTTSGRAGSSQNTGRRTNREMGSAMTSWMQKLWTRLRRQHWLCAETIPVFAKASTTVLSPSEEKEKKAKDMKHKLMAMMKANKIPTKEDIRQKELDNKKKKTPQLPYYLLEEHKLRAANAENLNILPIPSFREQNLCLFELRRHRLAKQGRLLYSTVPCPLDCGALQIQKRQLRHHLQHICPKRMIHCRFFAYCDSLFPAEMQEEHEAQSCNYLQRFSHAKFWAERAQWTKEHLRPCPDCNEMVVMLSAEQEEKLKKEIIKLKEKRNELKVIQNSPYSKKFSPSKAKTAFNVFEDIESDGNESDQSEEDSSDNQSLRLAEEHYQRSWVYHKDFVCVYRKVYCPRSGCSYAKPDQSQLFASSRNNFPSKDKALNGTEKSINSLEIQRHESEQSSSVTEIPIPPPRLPFHLLQYHLDHDCGGYEVQQRCVVIERARSRHPYPRPWGISITVPKVLDPTAINEMENAPLEDTKQMLHDEGNTNVENDDHDDIEDNGSEGDRSDEEEGDKNEEDEEGLHTKLSDEQEDRLIDV